MNEFLLELVVPVAIAFDGASLGSRPRPTVMRTGYENEYRSNMATPTEVIPFLVPGDEPCVAR